MTCHKENYKGGRLIQKQHAKAYAEDPSDYDTMLVTHLIMQF